MAAHIVDHLSKRAQAVEVHSRAQAGSKRLYQSLQHRHTKGTESSVHSLLKRSMYKGRRVSGNVSATRRVKRAAKSLKGSQRERFMRRVQKQIDHASVVTYDGEHGDLNVNMQVATRPVQRRLRQRFKKTSRVVEKFQKHYDRTTAVSYDGTTGDMNVNHNALKRRQYFRRAGKAETRAIKATLKNMKDLFFSANPLSLAGKSIAALLTPLGVIVILSSMLLFASVFALTTCVGVGSSTETETSTSTSDLSAIPEAILKDLEGATDAQKKIISAAYATGSRGSGYCAGYITDIYRNAGYGFIGGNANDMYWAYCTSSDFNELKPGMVIAVPKSPWGLAQIYGHIGLYIGNGKIRENATGPITETTLDAWIKTNGGWSQPRWGWFGGIKLA